jgi:hypothetical protein
MMPMMSEQTAKGYLDNRRDTLRRQIREFIASLEKDMDLTGGKLNLIPPSLYAEFQSLLIDYKKVKAFLEGF